MDERIMQFRVGVMVFASFLIALILIVLFGSFPSFAGTDTIKILFDEAPGVTQDTPVRKSGILIGRVTDVAFAKDAQGRKDSRVVVTAAIERRRRVYQNEICYVQSNLLGDATLEFVRSGDPSLSIEPIGDGEQIEGHYKRSPMSQLDQWEERISEVMETVNTSGKALTAASDELGKAAKTVDELLTDNRDNIDNAINRANQSLALVENVAKAMNNLVGDPQTQARLKASIDDLPDTIDSMKRTMKLAETSLENLSELTGPLRDEGPDAVLKILNTVDQLDGIMSQMNAFSRKLGDPNGSLSRLLEDREMYDHISRTVRNVDQLTEQLKPIMADARVFSDKIARHPELLGVRGAIQNNPGIK